MFHLALGDQFLDRARRVLDRHVRIDAMLIEQIDELHAQPLQRRIANLADALGTAVHAALLARFRIDGEPEFRGNHHPVAHGLERFADDLLIGERPIHLGRVEQGDAAIHRLTDQRDAFLPAQRVAVAEVQPHAAEADGRDFQILSKCACFHKSHSLVVCGNSSR